MDTSGTPYTMPFGEPDGLTFPPLYARLQREEPLARIRMAYGGEAWMVTRYDDVKTVLSDPRFSRAATVGADVARLVPAISHSTSVINLDPPEHTRLRKLVAKEFSVRHIEQLRPRITQITHELLDTMEKHGKPADLVRGLARPLPIQVICEVLGVPASCHYAAAPADDSQAIQAIQGFSRMHSYLTAAVAERRLNPTEDMLGALVQVRENDDRLSDEELVEFGMTLLMGGFETTAAEIANFTATLFRFPSYLAELRADPGLVPAAVEELLRMMPLSRAGFVRIATEDVELSGGTVGKGETILPYIHTANRDPEVFERPDELDFHRQRNPHLVFGFGPHHCIGAQLARMELQVALGTLLARFPTLDCAIAPEQIEYPKNKMVRGPDTLPVTW